MTMPRDITRRRMLKQSAAAAAVFTIVPRHVLGGPGHTPPSGQITRAVIGVGGMGKGHLTYNYGPLVAVCDVDAQHLQTALTMANKDNTDKRTVKGYHDFRELLERKDIDVVHIATPPHWHALISIAAANAGKDVWCEKPLTRTIGEGEKVVEAIRRNKRVLRINTWFRFTASFYGMETTAERIKKAVLADLLGRPLTVTIGACTGFDWKLKGWSGLTSYTPQAVPQHFDYNLWLGPAPVKPYHPHRTHGSFRGYWDYDAGGLGDMGQHYLDPAQYILGKDDESPIEIIPDTQPQHPDAVLPWNKVTLKYRDGDTLILDAVTPSSERVPYLSGPKGKIYRKLESDISNLAEKIRELPELPKRITKFEESVRTREKFALNEVNGHRSCTLINLASIAVKLSRPLKFDSIKQRFIDDDAANALIYQPMRKPWSISGSPWWWPF
jgi:predicted dehydrogenase